MTATTDPIEERLDDGTLPGVCEEEREDEDHSGDEEEHDPERRGDHPFGAVDTVSARLLPHRRLVGHLS